MGRNKKIFLSPNIRDEKITKLKNIELVENTNIKKKFIDEMKEKISYNEKKIINFNLFEKIYFFI